MSTIGWLKDVRRGGAVKRMHTEQTLTEYRNSSHQYNVTMIALELCKAYQSVGIPINAEKVMIACLTHDLPECDLGDIPAPAKRNSPEVKKAMDDLEQSWYIEKAPGYVVRSHAAMTQDEYDICKMSDYLELCMFCADERNLGNKSIEHVFVNARGYILNILSAPRFEDNHISSNVQAILNSLSEK